MAIIPASIIIPPVGGALPQNPTAILFHGLTATPQELEELGATLAREGYRVIIPCLPGHASSPEELKTTSLEQILDAVRSTFPYLSRRGSVVAGQSFGALLALWAAENSTRKPLAVALLSPPFRFRSRTRERVLKMLSKFTEERLNRFGFVRKSRRTLAIERNAYEVHSIGAGARLMRLRLLVVAAIKSLTMPILMLQDPFDHHLDAAGTDTIVEQFGSEEVDTLWFPRGEHELTLGPERTAVISAVVEFLRRARSKNAT